MDENKFFTAKKQPAYNSTLGGLFNSSLKDLSRTRMNPKQKHTRNMSLPVRNGILPPMPPLVSPALDQFTLRPPLHETSFSE
jgi:hypothetical protein